MKSFNFGPFIVYLVYYKVFYILRLGDGRMDSPGFSAKLCTYTLMEYTSNDILVMVLIDKRNADFKSTNMEVIGFEKAMDYLIVKGLKISEVVTDAHGAIATLTGMLSLLSLFIQNYLKNYRTQ